MSRLRTHFIQYWEDEHGCQPPFVWAICPSCKGEGVSVSYLGAYTQSDREEMGDEWYDFAEDVRAGMYDRPCEQCDGTGKVQEFGGAAAAEWEQWLRDDAEDWAVRRAESGLYGGW